MIWGFLIPGWLKKGAALLAGAALALLGAFYAGRREGKLAGKTDALEADRKANERINKANVSRGDINDDIDFLRKRSGK